MTEHFPGREKRKFERFSTEKEVFFTVTFEVKTKVNFQVVDPRHDQILPAKYPALSRNVSAAGISLVSLKKLDPGDILILEVYTLFSREPVFMEGQVRWCKPALDPHEGKFETGVLLTTIEGRDVRETFYHDEQRRVVWSGVLEAVLGSFRGS